MSQLISDAPQYRDPHSRSVRCRSCPSVGVIPRGAVTPPRWQVRCTPSREYTCDLCLSRMQPPPPAPPPMQPIGIFAPDRAQCSRCHASEQLPADGGAPDRWRRQGEPGCKHPTWLCPSCAVASDGAVASMRRMADRRAERRRR